MPGGPVPNAPRHAPPNAALRRRAWRWHFLAALLVIPFVLWQSVTGTLYLWSYAWMDAAHPALRFVEPGTRRASVDAQVQAARDARPGSRVASVLLPADPHRSTEVMFEDARGLPVAVFVDPYRGRLLGRLDAGGWWPGWSKKLHGGWPLGEPGSWLLELGACWTIVMVLTGLVLWWPRDDRTLRQALWPRLRAGPRVFWRDLHACVAVWSSLVIVLFLLTALPWTSFWGSTLLKPLQRSLGQQSPSAAGFSPVFVQASVQAAGPMPAATHAIDPQAASLDRMVRDARADGMDGDLLLRMVDGPADAAVSLRTQQAGASQERYALYDRRDGRRVETADWRDFPLMARTVATGVDIHEGGFFGRLGPWLNTAFAATLVWLSFTGILAWWRRKPADALGVPARPPQPWPRWLKAAAVGMGAVLPLLAISASLLWLAERGWLRIAHLTRR